MYQIEWQNILCSCTIKTKIDKDIFKKLTRKERKEALIAAALNRLDTPWKYQEFVCPCCSGIASVIDREEIIKAECHACSVKVVKKK